MCGRIAAATIALTATALALAGPAAAQQGTIRADGFNGTSLDTSVWTFVDPVGDAGVTVSGGKARISVPAGSTHDVWGNVNTSVGLRQPAPNRDFEIEAKFDSAVGSAYQMQGIVVEQDSNDLLRVEVHHDGGGTRLFVAAMTDGSASVKHYSTVSNGAPVYLRVVRQGNTWWVRYSRDGQSWTTTDPFTHAMTVNRVGPLVGNSGSPAPAWTAQLDSFREVLVDTTAPVISGVAATASTIGATVGWTTDEAASSVVTFGPTIAYGNSQVGAGGVTDHSVVLNGLTCGSTYHFQVTSTDASNNTAVGPDQTLTTAACPATAESDDFNGTSIDAARWTLVDPAGGATLSAGGGAAQISLPAGIQHDVWTNSDTVARLMQAAPNDSFEMMAKFDSVVAMTYQMQGFVVQQDPNDLLRLEVHAEGATTRLFAAVLNNGVASIPADSVNVPSGGPLYLRLRRSADRWTFSFSTDGATWPKSLAFTHAMTVSAVGLLAGNSGTFPPAFDERVDWFRFTPPDRTPPVIAADVSAAPGAGSTASATWTTDEPSSSEVDFGATNAYGSGTIAGPGDVRNHVVVLHGLKCNTEYHYRVRSVDPSSNTTTGTDRTFTSGPCPTLLTSDEFDAATLDSAKWAFIDPRGDSSMAIATGHAELSVPAGTSHDLWANVRTVPRLLQAAPNSDFEVVAKFDTAVGDTTQQQGLVVEEAHDKLLRFETYHEGSTTRLFVASISGGSADVLHSSIVPGASPVYLKLRRLGTRWTFSYSNDGEGWRTTSFDHPLAVTAVGPYVGNGGNNPPAFQGRIDYFREITDRTPPTITQVDARPVSRQAQVTWTTDEPAGTTVEYRAGTGAWQTASSTETETRHTVVAAGLSCATTYAFRVKSADALGNTATSPESSLTTTACTPAGGPDIDVWNGDTQTYGAAGVPQDWVNVTGNVSDPDGIQSLTGTLNDGRPEQLNFQPDGWRIQRPGDFNLEINHTELLPGNNTVELRATDTGGRVTTHSVTVNWQGQSAGAAAAANGPVLVVAAHPDDESLGQAGIIDRAKAAGRRVYVAIVTNGEGNRTDTAAGDCGAPADAAPAARYALVRDGEARDALTVLGLSWSATLSQTELIFLGYPGGRVPDVASAGTPLANSLTGVQRTFAEDFDNNVATCNGDLRYQLSGRHSDFTAAAMRDDLDSLLTLTAPSDVYTHVSFDGHPDHAEIARQVAAAVRRANAPTRLHRTMQHPQGDTNCMGLSSERWPNPSLVSNDPFARFTPTLPFTAPPAEPCNEANTATSWGPLGAPNESVDVPASMQLLTEATNKKWQAISAHQSQIDCTNPDLYHVNCGYMRAFVKRNEFFWKNDYGRKRIWSKPYTAQWTSNASIAQQAQILEGQWRFDGDGVRPLTTGFDRALLVGDMGWTDYDVKLPFKIHSFDPTTPQGAAVGLGVGWQGHNAWGQPRHGHPGGGLCLYARGGSDPMPFKLQIGYSPGPVDDTTLVSKDVTLAPGVKYEMRFRQQNLGTPGQTRYSCKVWRTDTAEPAAWDLTTDIPDWPGTTGQRPGSTVLLAHETDATFGDAVFTALP